MPVYWARARAPDPYLLELHITNTMEQATREACLKAMGIEIWRQRQSLPLVARGQYAQGEGIPSPAAVGVQPADVAFGFAVAGSLCLVFEPVTAADGSPGRRLLIDLVRALGGDFRTVAISSARWPESGEPEALSGGQVRRVLLLGETARTLAPALAEAGATVRASHGIAEMQAHPGLKRAVWEEARGLLQGTGRAGPSDG